MSLTTRDIEILKALTHHVRVFSLDQIARTWWPRSLSTTAEGRLRQIEQLGLITINRETAHPELAFESPVHSWSPTDPDPHFAAVSHKLQSRWKNHPILTPCISATKIAANRFGGFGGRAPRTVERTHDLHMARVYLIYRDTKPEEIPFWVFEERIKFERRRRPRVRGEKLPDVLIRRPASAYAVEFGGAYGPDKVGAFHGYCKDQSLSYEIW